eukprot:6180497-Pleurochrysis_carterae.AAC.2
MHVTYCYAALGRPIDTTNRGTTWDCPLSMTNAMCLVLGGKCRACRPAVRAPRVATSALADDEKPRSSGEASGHVPDRCGDREEW